MSVVLERPDHLLVTLASLQRDGQQILAGERDVDLVGYLRHSGAVVKVWAVNDRTAAVVAADAGRFATRDLVSLEHLTVDPSKVVYEDRPDHRSPYRHSARGKDKKPRKPIDKSAWPECEAGHKMHPTAKHCFQCDRVAEEQAATKKRATELAAEAGQQQEEVPPAALHVPPSETPPPALAAFLPIRAIGLDDPRPDAAAQAGGRLAAAIGDLKRQLAAAIVERDVALAERDYLVGEIEKVLAE